MAQATNGIEVEGLVREFKGQIRAVDGIDREGAPGEIYGFLGPNGAGKSTTVLMLTTLLPPTAGTAMVGGFDVRREGPRVREVIGAALQEAALDNFLTGSEHFDLQAGLHGMASAERRARATALLVTAAGVVHGTAPVEKVVSTVGAGDALLAGYLSAADGGGHALEVALSWGAAAVQHHGTLFATAHAAAPVAISDRVPLRRRLSH